MKILAIRGQNLASLSSKFEIDFSAEPLASAGLFAITGPTGAGKSTLLDALCLALYEQTPRLDRVTARSESVPDTGDHVVSTYDPRTLLRRGAGEGWAEVDFVGCDGVAYRSRWSIRRAYNKASGRLQPSELRLSRLVDGQVLGDHTKTETLRQIEARIGLNFEQFTRAVLLAQNDFVTFLKASDDQRAELLQTLTGTKTFAAISMDAYNRMQSENKALERLQQQIRDVAPLDPEAREARKSQLAQQAHEVQALEQQKSALAEQLRWLNQRQQLQQLAAQAEQRLAEAQAAHEAAQPRRERLALIDRTQPARLLTADLARARQAVTTAQQDLATQQTELGRAETDASLRQAAHEQSRQALDRAEQAKALAQPEIDQARALDDRLAQNAPRLQAARQARDEADRQWQAARTRQHDAEARLSQDRAGLEAAGQWLAQHEGTRTLAEGWQRWETLLAQAGGLRAHETRIEGELAHLQRQAGQIGADLDRASAEFASAAAQCTAAQDGLETLAQACAELDPEQLARDKAALEQRRASLQSASAQWSRLQASQGRQAKLEAQSREQSEALQQSRLELNAAADERPRREGELRSAEQALQAAQLAAGRDAVGLRATLQPEQPCPVCGSHEHPWATEHIVVQTLLQKLQAHVTDKQLALEELVRRQAAASALQTAAENALRDLAAELAQLKHENAAALSAWTAHELQHAIAVQPEPERAAWLQQQEAETQAELNRLSTQDARQRERLRERDLAQKALDTARTQRDQARERQQRLEQEHQATGQQLQAGQRRLAQDREALAGVLAQLDAAFAEPAWREPWRADPDAFTLGARTSAHGWTAKHQQASELRASLNTLTVKLQGYEDACAQALLLQQAQARVWQEAESDQKGYRATRAALFGDRPVAEVLAGFDAAITAAKSALAQARDDSQQAGEQGSRLREAARQADLRLAQHTLALQASSQQLDAWIAAFNADRAGAALTHADLDGLLALDPAWIAGERDLLQQLEHARHKADAVRLERRASLAQHEAGAPEVIDAQALAEQTAALERELQAALDLQARLRLELARDDERLEQSAALREAIEQQSARARVWSQLGELIGSADGKKFRNFAQQRTLDILLGYANAHLRSLTRRYRIERTRDSLGLLVVDQDMGEEVRSVHSLSGGESFLVSLAMALGLASLSSHRVRVESLFIDEGFGSLDSDSLNVAIDALDRLQSLGRKVGVISHVQEMTERIATRVQVRRLSGGASRVTVTGR